MHVDAFTVNGQAATSGTTTALFTVAAASGCPRRCAARLRATRRSTGTMRSRRESNREGMLDSTTYYLAYFYPRVAVYDDYNGWDTMDFTDPQEFYSDFNDYDVTVNVPANYVVWGTGTLRNPSDVLQPEILAALPGVAHVGQTYPRRDARRARARSASPRSNAMNAWHFTATNIPDVTFDLSDHYVWDAASVVVDDATNRRASVQAAYNDTAADFHHMVQFGQHALDWLSHNWPGVPYPYEKTTIVQGIRRTWNTR